MKTSPAMKRLPGGITVPLGFSAWGVHCGIKSRQAAPDLGVIVADAPCTCAGTVTQNRIRSSAADWDEALFRKGLARAVVVNSGNANACTGRRGVRDTHAMANLAARKLRCDRDQVLVCSTGVIGEYLPLGKVRQGIADSLTLLRTGRHADQSFARSILTTDTRIKQRAYEVTAMKGKFRIAGVAKGSGMIAPNMATMLCFLTTDAGMSAPLLRTSIADAVDKSFNRISVDGHTSTSDTVVVLASGKSGVRIQRAGKNARVFHQALIEICRELAREIVLDGEGATKIVDYHIRGARTPCDLRRVADALMQSPLNKTMFFGEDLNWGRLVSSIGYSGADFSPGLLSIRVGKHIVFSRGMPRKTAIRKARPLMRRKAIEVTVHLGAGGHGGTYTSCDLSYDYVAINASYRT